MTVDKHEQMQKQVQANHPYKKSNEETSSQMVTNVNTDSEANESKQSLKRDTTRKSEEIKNSTIGGF